MKTRVRKALILVNTFGALGYLTMVLVWALFASAVLFLLMQSSILSTTVAPSPADVIQPSGGEVLAAKIFAYLIAIIMVVLACTILFLLPYLIGKWGARAMRHLMKWCRVPVTRRNLFLTKGMVIIMPLIGFIILSTLYTPQDMTIPAAHISAVFLSLLSLGCFLLQIASARSLAVDVKHMW